MFLEWVIWTPHLVMGSQCVLESTNKQKILEESGQRESATLPLVGQLIQFYHLSYKECRFMDVIMWCTCHWDIPEQREAVVDHHFRPSSFKQSPHTITSRLLHNCQPQHAMAHMELTWRYRTTILLSLRFSVLQLITTSAPTSLADSSLPSTMSAAYLGQASKRVQVRQCMHLTSVQACRYL